MSKLRVLIVDDSAFMRKALRRMIDAEPDLEVAGTAADGAEGVRLARELKPDLVTLDVKMPVMDGLEALKQILADRSVPVLMLSSLTAEGADTTLRALELGALDFIDKSTVSSTMDITSIAPTLVAKIRALAAITQEKVDLNRAPLPATPSAPRSDNVPAPTVLPGTRIVDMVVVGSSTGGPACIQALLLALPADYPYPVVIVQHMPAGFTRSLAERLNSICSVEVMEAVEGTLLIPGRVVIAPAGQHLIVRKRDGRLYANLSVEPAQALHKPSADVLFASAVKAVGTRLLGVLLTGMGKDGAQGLLAIKASGGMTVAQDEATSVVWGMPRAAVEIGAAQHVLPLLAIRQKLLEIAGLTPR